MFINSQTLMNYMDMLPDDMKTWDNAKQAIKDIEYMSLIDDIQIAKEEIEAKYSHLSYYRERVGDKYLYSFVRDYEKRVHV